MGRKYENVLEELQRESRERANRTDFLNNSNNFSRRENLCERFAQILESSIIQSEDDLCVVTRRRNIDATIKGVSTESPLVINALFSFEPARRGNETLNLGETVILQNEINPFISALRERGIKVTGLHNHWLFEDPRLFYIHFLTVEDPISFARKVAEAFEVLENNNFND